MVCDQSQSLLWLRMALAGSVGRLCTFSAAQVLDVPATAVDEEVGSLLRGIDHVQIELQLFDFLGNAVLAKFYTQLAAAIPGAHAGHHGSHSWLLSSWHLA